MEALTAIGYRPLKVRAPVLCLETLIAMKEAAGRTQDLADASLLRDLSQLPSREASP